MINDLADAATEAENDFAAQRQESPRAWIRSLRADEIPKRRTDWVWLPFFPRGMVVAIHGEPGLGKSAMLIDLVAKLTQGNEMPNGVKPRPVGVTLLIGDDDIGKTVIPRLEAAGAQMCLVDILLDVEEVDEDEV